MITFEKKSQKNWEVYRNDEMILNLNFISSSVTNKYNIVSDFITNVSTEMGDEFDDWFCDFFVEYKEKRNLHIVETNINILKDYVDKYIDSRKIDFTQFVNMKKVKKGTILFEPHEIEQIIKVSGYLKLYSIISNSTDMPLSRKLHKEAYNMLIAEISGSDIVFKIFNVVKTKTYRYNLTDKYMWEYIQMIQCKSIDVHTVEIFNFIMNSILILCEEDKNPITYFVGVVEESVKWFLRSVYKKTIIYDDSISTEDIHGLNIDNLKTYAYNDTLGRLKGIAYEQIYQELDKSNLIPLSLDEDSIEYDKNISEFQNRVLSIEYVSPLSDCLIFPLLSRMTDIPYSHFTTLTPEHSIILSVYMQKILRKVFKSDYQELFNLLNFYPTIQPAIATTYRIKQVNDNHGFINIQNSVRDFFGFSTITLPYQLMSYFVGRTSRVSFCNIYDGKKLVGIPLSKIEADVIKFYTLYFAGRLDDKIEEMTQYMDRDF